MTLSYEQQRVYDWLNSDLGLPVFADAYKGSVFLLCLKPAGYITFVAHLGRDLMNSLAPTVAGIKSNQVQYVNYGNKLQTSWQVEWGHSTGFLPTGSKKGHLIPIHICKIITNLVEDHKSGRKRNSEADGLFFNTFLDYPEIDKIPRNFLTEWQSAKSWFMKHTHLRKKSFSSEDIDNLEKHFSCLNGYLYIAASSQYERLKALDEILDETNK